MKTQCEIMAELYQSLVAEIEAAISDRVASVFADRYVDGIASRIHEDGAFIVCDGHDMRRSKP